MRLLITGGCGFLGSNLASHAVENGIELCVFDNLYRNGSVKNLEWLRSLGELKFCHGDIRNQNDVTRVVRDFKPDIVFHLAGQVAMTTSIINPRMDFEVNVVGTHNLIEAIRQEAMNTGIIYSSTNKVYGDLEQYTYIEKATRYECLEMPLGFDESTQLDFHSPYGCSKGAADQYILDYSRIFGIKTAIFRHSSMYGGRQYATEDQGWIGWFCQKALEIKNGKTDKPLTISGNGKQVRDVLYADDIIRLYFDAAKNIETISGQAFNIGGGHEYSLSLLELFSLLEKKCKTKIEYTSIDPRQSDQKIFIADTRKIKRILNWEANINCDDGIQRMLEWIERSQE